MLITVDTSNKLCHWEQTEVPCAIGRSGARRDKIEGDGASPIGRFPLRTLFIRPDRIFGLNTLLSPIPLSQTDGWCDSPNDPAYNRLVKRPYPASHEILWREDEIYDVILVIGYNDDPPLSGQGSAIFLHVARPDYTGTEGCIALSKADLFKLLEVCPPGSEIEIT